MTLDPLMSIAMILGLGMMAQWVAWRLRLPSILFLLILGLIVGPIAARLTGQPVIDIENLFGDLLFPSVAAAVAIILFEGGLSLRFSDIRGSGQVVGKLVTLGVLVSWGLAGIFAHYLLDLEWGLALLLGATLSVTGPTVIIPLLQQIRPKGRVGSILRWEGIIIDPIGAVLALLVLEEILFYSDIISLFILILKTAVIGLGLGWLTAQAMIELFRRYYVPDSLQNPVALGFVLVAFAISNQMQPESGLLTVTVMGITMANQNRFDIHHIVEFKETLQVLLLSSLFIVLAARMSPDDLAQIGLPTLEFVVILILVVRPIGVLFSTFGSQLNWRERVFLAWMAPRGIVAASVASVFALELHEQHFEGGETLVPITFAVIIGSVGIYSLTAGFLAQRLGLAERNPQGLLIVGGARWIRMLAQEIQRLGFRVVISDTNHDHVLAARQEGLEVFHGNVLSEVVVDEIDFAGLGRLLAMTRNPEINALAGEHFRNMFGSDSVFELQREGIQDKESISHLLGGRYLFPKGMTHTLLNERFHSGARVMTITIADIQEVQACMPKAITPLFVIPDDERLQIWTYEDAPRLQNGYRLIGLIESEFYDELVEKQAIEPRAEDLQALEASDTD